MKYSKANRVFVLFILLVIVFSSPIPARADTNTVKFTDFLGLVIFTGEINGIKGKCLLDTGADATIINTKFAKRHNLKEVKGPLSILGAGAVSQYTARQIAVGDWYFENATLTGIDLSIVDRYLGFELMAVVGADLFYKYALTVDYQEDYFTLSDQAPSVRSSATIVPTRISDRLTFAKGKTSANGPEYTYLVDTGATSTAYFKNRMEECCPDYKTWPRSLGWIEATFLGQKEADMYLMPTFYLGDAGIESAIVTVTEPGLLGLSLGFLSASPVHGIVGYTYLRYYKVTFDYPRSRLILEPYENYVEKWPHLMDSVGFMIAYENDVPFVEHVLPDTPAETSGVMDGDKLATIDGVDVVAMDSLAISKLMMGKPGTQVVVVFDRGGKKIRKTLKRVHLFKE